MARLIKVALIATLAIVSTMSGIASADELATDSPRTIGQGSAPSGTGIYDNGEVASAGTYSYLGCNDNYTWPFNNIDIEVRGKICIERRNSDLKKRTKARLSCFSISSGVAQTCHFWWNVSPLGSDSRRQLLTKTSSGWTVTAYTQEQSDCLNCYTSVAYSGWAPDQSNRYIIGVLRDTDMTLHGGVLAGQFEMDTLQVYDQ
jgi:hypothetical protein